MVLNLAKKERKTAIANWYIWQQNKTLNIVDIYKIIESKKKKKKSALIYFLFAKTYKKYYNDIELKIFNNTFKKKRPYNFTK